MKKIFTCMASLLAALTISTASADTGETIFSYFDSSASNPYLTGLGLNGGGDGEYNIGMKIPASLAGYQIKGIKVPFANSNGFSGFSAWASKTLNTVFNPDIASAEFTPVPLDGNSVAFTLVEFDEPITIPEKGVYVGYSFTITDGTTKKHDNAKTAMVATMPLAIEGSDDVFMVRYSGSGSYNQAYLPWTDLGNPYGSCMQVILTGIPERAINVAPILSPVRVIGNRDNTYNITLTNLGYKGATEVEYTTEIAGKTATHTYTIPASTGVNKEGFYGKTFTIPVEIGRFDETGEYDISFELTKVNGVENASTAKSASNKLYVYGENLKKNPVIEESTCTKCGFCTMGFYGLEVMNRLYPEVIAISYHNTWQGTDPMAVIEPPFPATGNPAAYVDRVLEVPFDKNDRTATMEGPWLERKETIVPCEMTVTAEWADENQEAIHATAKANFIFPEENARYRFEFALLHDQMTGKKSEWVQTNYYGGGLYGSYPEPEWDKFRDETQVRGLKYDDIFILGGSRNMKGIMASVPTSIKANSTVSYTHTFGLSNAINMQRENIVQDKTKLRVVAMLIDANTNEIINAAKCVVPGYVSGVEDIVAEDGDVYPVAYYDITGIEVKNPENGIYLVRMSDGSTVKKVIRK